jgi:hypothetical protein
MPWYFVFIIILGMSLNKAKVKMERKNKQFIQFIIIDNPFRSSIPARSIPGIYYVLT